MPLTLPEAVLGVRIDTKDAESSLSSLGSSFHKLTQTAYTAFQRVFTLFTEVSRQVTVALTDSLNKFQGFIATMQAATGSVKIAREEYAYLRKISDDLGVRVDTLTVNYARLAVSLKDVSDGGQISRDVFLGIAQAARTMHLGAEDTRLMFYAVTQMASKGVVSMEELRRQLGEKLPGVMKIAADSIGKTTTELEKMVRSGKMQAIPFLRVFGPALQEAFGESAVIAASSLDAAIARVQNLWQDFTVHVLDTGAADALIGAVDAVRDKLVESHAIEIFGETVRKIAIQFTEFVQSLTQQDIEGFFKSISTGFQLFADVLENVGKGFKLIADNADTIVKVWAALKGAGIGAGAVGRFTKHPGAIAAGALGGAAIGWTGAQTGIDWIDEQFQKKTGQHGSSGSWDEKPQDWNDFFEGGPFIPGVRIPRPEFSMGGESEADKAAKRLREQQDAAIRSYRERLNNAQQLTEYEKLSFELSEGKFRHFDAETRHQLQVLAARANELQIEKEIDKIREDGLKKETDQAAKYQAEADALMRAYDPMVDYYELLKKIDILKSKQLIDPMIGDAIAMNALSDINKRNDAALEKQKSLIDDIRKAFQESSAVIADGFGEMIKNGGTFSDILKQIAMDMLDIAYNALVLKPLTAGLSTALVGNEKGKMGGFVGWAMNLFMHDGGIVGSGAGSYKMVNPFVFANAPRLHNGLAPDEFPAILQRGEQVIPKDQVNQQGVTVEQNIYLTVESSGNAEKDGQQIIATITPAMRNIARDVVMTELRPTGVFNR